jgi:uncharacterized protein
VHLLGSLTLLFFGGGGLLLIIYQGRDPLSVLIGISDLWLQIFLGAAMGLLIGSVAWGIIQLRFMRSIRTYYSDMIGPLIASRSDRIFISICAGVGEEIFFRGALQYWLGIPVTAIIFVAIHGYLDPRNWRISVYGGFMTIAMMAIGWVAERYGLLAPIIAHTLIDIVLLERLHSQWRSQQNGHASIQS